MPSSRVQFPNVECFGDFTFWKYKPILKDVPKIIFMFNFHPEVFF